MNVSTLSERLKTKGRKQTTVGLSYQQTQGDFHCSIQELRGDEEQF